MTVKEKLEMFENALTLMALRAKVAANREAGLPCYSGMASSDIGRLNRAVMFGDNDEAFPDDDEWSMIVD